MDIVTTVGTLVTWAKSVAEMLPSMSNTIFRLIEVVKIQEKNIQELELQVGQLQVDLLELKVRVLEHEQKDYILRR